MTLRATRILALAFVALAPSVAHGDTRCPLGATCDFSAHLARFRATHPKAVDQDADGIPDAREEQLARRFAPVVVLDGKDWTRPASVQWLLSRLRVGARHDEAPKPGLRLALFPPRLQRGSRNPRDWKTYVHTYASRNGQRLHVQYWFFYPYNDGSWIFDHEGDWEHVTVTLDNAGRPLGVHAAQHGHNAPGQWRRWQDVTKLHGTHPRILSAKGSHASYFDESDVGWRDTSSRCAPSDKDCARVLWNTWEGGGLTQLGERHSPREAFMMKYRGRWGALGSLPGMSGPRGPAFQSSWCFDGDAGCTRPRR